MDTCIVSFAEQGRENYVSMLERMVNQIVNMDIRADVLVFSPNIESDLVVPIKDKEETIYITKGYPKSFIYGECKSNKEEPYQFKSFSIQVARERRYERIIWFDSSILVTNDMSHYLKLLDEVGVITFNNPGCPVNFYTSDDCIEHLGEDPKKDFDQIDAAIMMFNFKHEKANILFDEYFEHCRDGICLNGKSGSDRPEFKAHRHDQSIMSYLIRKHHINPIDYGGWCYANDYGKFNSTFIKAYNGWGVQNG